MRWSGPLSPLTRYCGWPAFAGLEKLLQRGLMIADAAAALQRSAQFFHIRFDDPFFDEDARRLQTTIQIDRPNDRFETVCQQRGLLASAAPLLALAQEEACAQIQLERYLPQMLPADQPGPQPGQLPFLQLRIAAVERIGRNQANDRIAEEFKLFIIEGFGSRALAQRPGNCASLLCGFCNPLLRRMRAFQQYSDTDWRRHGRSVS